jgi:glycosyltransferase involved in cell wall biosynthesis
VNLHEAGVGSSGYVTDLDPGRPRRSVAILVDDLATWLVAGLQPSGIQRVVSEVLDTAYARRDIRAWPAVSIGGLRPGERLLLSETAPDSLRWEAHQGGVDVKLRSLRLARKAMVRLPIPRRVRRSAKEAYAHLALAFGGIRVVGRDELVRPDLLLVPGGFSNGDSAARLRRFVDEGVPVRVIVYDLFPVTNPEWCVPEVTWSFKEALDTLLPVADRVVTLSDEVANQIAERYPGSAGRIRVAVPTLRAHAPRSVRGSDDAPAPVPGPFLLALSTVEPRKNHRVILDAWRLLHEDPSAAGARLVIAGRRGWKADDIEAEIARDAERLGIVRLGHATDEVVEALYRDCLATVHASWAEGFGLPVRESVVRGIPTLMSSTIPRDGLPDGTYRMFDPTDARGLADLMVEAIAAGHVRTPIALGDGTGWEPVLSALVD